MRPSRHVSLNVKLYAAFGLILACMVGLAIFAMLRVSAIGQALQRQEAVRAARLEPLYVAREALGQTGIAARNALIFKDESAAARELDLVDAQKGMYLAALAKLAPEFAGDAQFARVEQGLTAMARELERPRRYRQAGTLDTYGTFLVEECTPLRRRIVADIDTLLRQVEAQASAARANALEQEEGARRWIGAACVASLLIAAAVAAALTRSVQAQLGGDPAVAVTVATRIASGDLLHQVDAGHARASSLMAAMKTMRDNLAAIVGKVRSSTDSITASSSEIARGNLDLSGRTDHQAGALEALSVSMKGVIESVRDNARSAEEASQLAEGASTISVEGGAVVRQVVETMGEIDGASRRIADIVGVIDAIAFQTNILALNAAVEAARAGEQGKGFAVVAAEVRNLAQRSAAAAREVKSLIDDSVSRVAGGTALVRQAGATMETVVSEIHKVSVLMGDISVAARRQQAGIEQIDGAILQLEETTQQNAALVEEAAAAAQSLQQQAEGLSQAVQAFQLERSQLEAQAPVRPQARLKGRPRLALH